MSVSTTVIRVPASDKEFEEACVPLFAGFLNDPTVKTVGTSGQNQHGLDLLGARDGDPRKPVGVQCKLRTKGGKLNEALVRTEVRRALQIEPKLTEYYIIATTPDDTVMDLLAMRISQEQADLGRTIVVKIWGWDTAQQHIRNYPKALQAFDPGYSPVADAMLSLGSETFTQGQETHALVLRLAEAMRPQAAAPGDPGRGGGLDSHLHDQVDQYRDLINDGQARTALKLLLQLEEKLGVGESAAIRARIRANIGWCHLRLGEDRRAGELLLEAYVLNPHDPKVVANRVLGLILTGDVAGAATFGCEAIEADPANAGVAAFLYQAATLEEGVIDPDAVVPDALKGDPAVMLHRTSLLRHRGAAALWHGLAAEALAAHPQDRALHQMAGEALVDAAFGDQAFERNPIPSAAAAEQLARGVALLAPVWEAGRKSETPEQPHLLSLAVNLANAYRAQGLRDDAKRVIAEALAICPDDANVVATGLFMALDEDDILSAGNFVRRLPEGPVRSIQLLNVLAREGDWPALLSEATPARAAGLESDDRRAWDALVFQARLHAEAGLDVVAAAKALAAEWPDSVATLVVACDAIRTADPEGSTELFVRALELLDEATPYGDRMMLAEMAGFRQAFDAVIGCLDGYVRTNRDSRALLSLALAYANAAPRPQTHTFFESLPKTVIELPRYARLAGVAEASRGDLGRAEKHLRVATAKDPRDLRAHLHLHSVLRRGGRDPEATAYIAGLDETKQDGSPRDLMRLAQSLAASGEVERGAALAYAVARAHPRDVDIAAAYPPLILTAKLPPGLLQDSRATPDIWFDLEGEGVEDIDGVIEVAPVGENSYALDHPLAREVLGKAVGDAVVLTHTLAPDRVYKVRALRHKYLWLMRQLMERHAQQFPESNKLIALSVQDHNVQPILDMVRKLSEHNELLGKAYSESPSPLEMLAAMSGRTVIELAEQLPSAGIPIRSCIGHLGERRVALRAIKSARGQGAVLDTLTVWVARQLGLLPSMKTYFGRLVVPRAAIDALVGLRAQRELHRGEEYMTLGYQGHQAVRDVQPPEATERVLDLLDATLAEVQACSEVLPKDGCEDLTLDAATLELIGEGDVLDPICLAQNQNLLLVSDDLHLRQWAKMAGVPRGAWLQPVIWSLLDAELIGEDDYALAIAQLGARQHGHLWLDVDALKAVCALEGDRAEAALQAILPYIGGPKADLQSHIGVVGDFLHAVARSQIPGRAGRAADAIVTRLLSGQEKWRAILIALDENLALRSGPAAGAAREWLGGWLRGHFLLEPFNVAG